MPFEKGKSGNPGGRKKRTQAELDLIKACRQSSPAALDVIKELMKDSAEDSVRLRAAVHIIERGYGTPIPQNPAEQPSAAKKKQVVLNVKDARIRADAE